MLVLVLQLPSVSQSPDWQSELGEAHRLQDSPQDFSSQSQRGEPKVEQVPFVQKAMAHTSCAAPHVTHAGLQSSLSLQRRLVAAVSPAALPCWSEPLLRAPQLKLHKTPLSSTTQSPRPI